VPKAAESTAKRVSAENMPEGSREAVWIARMTRVADPPVCTESGVNVHCAQLGSEEQAKLKVVLPPELTLVLRTMLAGCAADKVRLFVEAAMS
jgi:hypothetical protein